MANFLLRVSSVAEKLVTHSPKKVPSLLQTRNLSVHDYVSPLQDRIVLVTGSSSGIGEATAKEFAKHGARLSLVSTEKDRLEKVAEECRAAGSPQVLTSVCDLSLESGCRKAVDDTTAFFNGLDVFVNSAGILVSGNVEDVSLDDYDRCMALNTRAPFILTKLCLPHLIKSQGNIVYISSINSIRPAIHTAVYGMSKSAIDGLARTLAMTVGEHGVRVNTVNPGTVRTNLLLNAGLTDEESKVAFENMNRLTVRGQVGDPTEIASTVVFLASDLASYVTGQNLVVDGGYSIKANPDSDSVDLHQKAGSVDHQKA